jgi:hypothetical protein
MVFGDRSTFAIDCEITSRHPPHQALGKFVVYLAGRRFGVDDPEASMLANSIDAIGERILNRGLHIRRSFDATPAAAIANAYLSGTYRGDVSEQVDWSTIIWVPDGDEAFDDGSHILQMDIGSSVRLIGFQNTGDALTADDVVELTMLPDAFYSVLAQCVDWYRGQIR